MPGKDETTEASAPDVDFDRDPAPEGASTPKGAEGKGADGKGADGKGAEGKGAEGKGADSDKQKRKPRAYLDDFLLEIDPERVDEAVRALTERVRRLVDQGRYTRVRIKYKGKPLMPDIPLGVFLATEAVTFWYTGLLRALVVNLGVRTFIEVEFVHDAEQKVREGIELYMDGEVDAAEDKYREALRMRGDDTAALYNLGVLLRVTGRRKEAIDCLEKAVVATGHPDAERAAEALERMKRGPRTL